MKAKREHLRPQEATWWQRVRRVEKCAQAVEGIDNIPGIALKRKQIRERDCRRARVRARASIADAPRAARTPTAVAGSAALEEQHARSLVETRST